MNPTRISDHYTDRKPGKDQRDKIFVPCTPNEELKKKYEQEISKSGFNAKVIEESGIKIKDVLHKRNPFKVTKSDRDNYFVRFYDGKAKGLCNKENVIYKMSCAKNCGRKNVYQWFEEDEVRLSDDVN